MGKRIWLAFVIFIMLFSTGCEFTLNPAAAPQDTPVVLSDSQIEALSALSTQVNQTSDGLLPLPTDTPTPTVEGQGGGNPTNTPMPGNIAITGIKETSPGVALVTWEVMGEFPSGFRVVWTDQQGLPTYPESNSILAGSATARSAVINVSVDTIYYVRVCRLLYGVCDIYSELEIFAFAASTPTPDLNPMRTATAASQFKTATAASRGTGGTVVAYDSSLVITLMKGGETGKAYMAWTDKGSSPNGYRIIYSKTSSTPTYGADSSYVVSSPSARFAYVDGTSKTTYHYRICRYISSGCGTYSATYTYTFPTVVPTADTAVITITGVKDNATVGDIDLTWTKSGTFADGFKLLFSTNSTPTTSNSTLETVASGSATTATLTGTVEGTKYYLRVCKYTGSTCGVYSNIVEFTTATTDIILSATADKNIYDISVTPTNAEGYYLFWAAGTLTPVWAGTLSYEAGAELDTSITIDPPLANGHYILRLCNVTGTICTAYSNTIEVDIP